MEEEKDKKRNLSFLYSVCKNVNHTSLTYWLNNEYFYNEISRVIWNKGYIDQRMVFETMREIYLYYESAWEYTGIKPDFNFYIARRGIQTLCESLTGSRDGWREYHPA